MYAYCINICIQNTVYYIHYIAYRIMNVYCTYVFSILYIAYRILYIVHSIIYVYCTYLIRMRYIAYSILYIVYSIMYVYILYICIQYTVYCKQYTLQYIVYILCISKYSIGSYIYIIQCYT